MTKYLLDANVLIDWLKGRNPAGSAVEKLTERGDLAALNLVILAELHSGLDETERAAVDELLAAFDFWELDRDDGRLAGHYRYTYARQGRKYAVADMLIGSQAILREATLVTDNIRDFPMPELRIVRPADLL